jgi:hypothetical protein
LLLRRRNHNTVFGTNDIVVYPIYMALYGRLNIGGGALSSSLTSLSSISIQTIATVTTTAIISSPRYVTSTCGSITIGIQLQHQHGNGNGNERGMSTSSPSSSSSSSSRRSKHQRVTVTDETHKSKGVNHSDASNSKQQNGQRRERGGATSGQLGPTGQKSGVTRSGDTHILTSRTIIDAQSKPSSSTATPKLVTDSSSSSSKKKKKQKTDNPNTNTNTSTNKQQQSTRRVRINKNPIVTTTSRHDSEQSTGKAKVNDPTRKSDAPSTITTTTTNTTNTNKQQSESLSPFVSSSLTARELTGRLKHIDGSASNKKSGSSSSEKSSDAARSRVVKIDIVKTVQQFSSKERSQVEKSAASGDWITQLSTYLTTAEWRSFQSSYKSYYDGNAHHREVTVTTKRGISPHSPSSRSAKAKAFTAEEKALLTAGQSIATATIPNPIPIQRDEDLEHTPIIVDDATNTTASSNNTPINATINNHTNINDVDNIDGEDATADTTGPTGNTAGDSRAKPSSQIMRKPSAQSLITDLMKRFGRNHPQFNSQCLATIFTAVNNESTRPTPDRLIEARHRNPEAYAPITVSWFKPTSTYKQHTKFGRLIDGTPSSAISLPDASIEEVRRHDHQQLQAVRAQSAQYQAYEQVERDNIRHHHKLGKSDYRDQRAPTLDDLETSNQLPSHLLSYKDFKVMVTDVPVDITSRELIHAFRRCGAVMAVEIHRQRYHDGRKGREAQQKANSEATLANKARHPDIDITPSTASTSPVIVQSDILNTTSSHSPGTSFVKGMDAVQQSTIIGDVAADGHILQSQRHTTVTRCSAFVYFETKEGMDRALNSALQVFGLTLLV